MPRHTPIFSELDHHRSNGVLPRRERERTSHSSTLLRWILLLVSLGLLLIG